MTANVLIVEDERITALNIEERLRKLGYGIAGNVASAEKALSLACQTRPDIALMDIHLAGEMDGIEAARRLRDEHHVPVVFLTANADQATMSRAEGSGPYGYLLKPFDPRELDAAIRIGVTRHRAENALSASEERLQLALEAAELGSWELDTASGQVKRGGRTDRLFGIPSETLHLEVQDFCARVHPEDREAVRRATESAAESYLFRVEFRRNGEAQPAHWLVAQGKRFGNRLVGVVQDVTERRVAERRLQQARAVFDHTAEAIVILDHERHVQAVNPAFRSITGYTADEVTGHPLTELCAEATEPVWATAAGAGGHWQGEVRLRRKDGETFPAWLNTNDVQAGDGQAVVVFSDISALKEAERRLSEIAYYDALTDLPNRLLFRDRLEHALKGAQRSGRQVALLFLDLDRFKTINDTLGHEVGDRLLCEIARRVVESLRSEDTAARLGGDEFVVLLDRLRGPEDAGLVAGKLLAEIERPFEIAGRTLEISASIGISVFPQDGEDFGALLKAADIAMYAAKAQGCGRYRYHTAEMSRRLGEILETESGLRQALSRGEFVLHYQPQVGGGGRVRGAEALVRWQHPERGLVAPGEFIAVAEEAGLIEAIGEWVLHTACREAAAWRARGLPFGRVAVNLSPLQMRQPRVVESVRAALVASGLPAAMLELEITESALQTGGPAADVLTQLKALGVEIAIDDFGTGYSCLNSLKQLPIDRLKIDRSFVRDVPGDADDTAIVEAILAMSHSLGLGVLAEGVETEAQRDYLLAHGCHDMQGFLFSRPLPAPEFARQLGV